MSLLSLIGFGPIYRSWHASNHIISLYDYFACMDAIAIGCIAAIFKRKRCFNNKVRILAIGAASALVTVTYFYSRIMPNIVFGVSLIAFGTGVIIYFSEGPPLFRFNRIGRVTAWMGRLSYELYLFHIIVLAFMKITVSRSELPYYLNPLWFGFYMAISLLIALVVSRHYAEPLNKFFRKTH